MEPNYYPQPEIPYTIDVKDTNMEALKAKSSAVALGYLKDDFVKYIVKEKCKKDIIINRGYWSRTYAIQYFQDKFLMKEYNGDTTERQIISFGCGYDTFVFNLFAKPNKSHAKFKYFESDLKEVVQKKVQFITKTKQLSESFKGENLEVVSDSHIKSQNYGLIDADLSKPDEVSDRLSLLGVDYTKPTMIFFECVLAYIEKKHIINLLQFLKSKFTRLIIVDYEMFNPHDPFGKIMVKNFNDRGCPLKGLEFFISLESIKQHYESIFQTGEDGHNSMEIHNMNDITKLCLDPGEHQRILKLEFLDEYEEYWLMQGHYFISSHKYIKSNGQSEVEKKADEVIHQFQIELEQFF